MKMKHFFKALAILLMLNFTAFAGQANSSTGRKVMLLSSAVAQGDVLAEAAKDDVTVIRYETKTTTLDNLVTMVRERLNGDVASSDVDALSDYI